MISDRSTTFSVSAGRNCKKIRHVRAATFLIAYVAPESYTRAVLAGENVRGTDLTRFASPGNINFSLKPLRLGLRR